jgi:TP901 family phage tail tape measure protein
LLGGGIVAKGISEMLVKIGLDTSGFEKQAQQFRKNFRQLGTQMQQVGAQMTTAFSGVALAVGGALAYTVTKAIDFEQAMKNASTAADDGGKSFKQLQALALEMGSKTSFSAKEAADGMTELLKAGMSVENVMAGGLKAALDLAVIGGMELAEAAAFTSDAMASFKKDGLTAAQTANILAGAANKSSADLAGIQYSLAAVGSVANTVGMSLKDTATAIAIFANSGLKGSDAGTSLKTMLLNLSPASKEQKKLAEELGIITADGSNQFYDQAGNLKDLKSITQIITKTFKRYTAQQRTAMMQTLFGTDAIRAASILYDAGAESIGKMNIELGNVDAAQQATEKQNTLAGAIERLKGSFETAAISIGTQFIPGLTSLAGYLDRLVSGFNALPEPIQKMIAYGLAITAGFAALTAVVGGLVFALGALAAAEWAVILPIAGIVLAVTAVIAALVAFGFYVKNLYQTNESFRVGVQKVWGGVVATIQGAWSLIQPVLQAIGSFFGEIFGLMYGVLVQYWPAIVAVTSVYLDTMSKVFQYQLNFMLGLFKWLFIGIKAVVITNFETITTIIKGFVTVATGFFKVFASLIKGDWQGLFDGLAQVAKGFGQIFYAIWTHLWRTIINLFQSAGVDIKGFFTDVLTSVQNLGSKMYDAGANLIGSIIDGIKSKVSAIGSTMSDVASKIRGYLPFSPAKEGPLSDLNRLDFAGPITDSILGGVPTVQTALDSMLTVNQAQAGFSPNNSQQATNTTLVIQLDGKTISRSVFANMGGVFRVSGAVT